MQLVPIPSLGEALHHSPISSIATSEIYLPSTVQWPGGNPPEDLVFFEKAGPRAKLFFNPAETTAAIVTCGGLCPGLNNVIRSVTRELRLTYGVNSVIGIRDGYAGLDPSRGRPPIELTEEFVEDIHHKGGTVIGTSRGPVDVSVAVDFLAARGVDILFTVGGDGTQRGGNALYEEAARRGRPLAVVGIPKTIDNDIRHVTRTFGFATAVEEAVRVIASAHTEARSVNDGVSLVKLMGRHAGFIAAAATVASQDVNFCLIPELPFSPDAFIRALEKRLADKDHAVIVVAEGAGQDLLGDSGVKDASGNAKLRDIGVFLRDRILSHFHDKGIEMVMRYFDPSYQIRGCAANTEDAVLCDRLARNAVHAAMSGRTGMVISFLHGHFAHVSIGSIAAGGRTVELDSELWRAVLASTGQAPRFE